MVPGQFTHYPHGGRPFSPSSSHGDTAMSPQMRPYTFKEHVDAEDPISRPGTVPPPVPPKDDQRKCGMKKRSFFILLGCIVIWVLALALGLGLGLGLGLKKNNNSYVTFLHFSVRGHLLTHEQELNRHGPILSREARLLYWWLTQCELHLEEGRFQRHRNRISWRVMERRTATNFHSLLPA